MSLSIKAYQSENLLNATFAQSVHFSTFEGVLALNIESIEILSERLKTLTSLRMHLKLNTDTVFNNAEVFQHLDW